MIDFLQKVEEFHIKYKHYIGSVTVVPPSDVLNLRRRLINEEAQELVEALDNLNRTYSSNDRPSNVDKCYIAISDAIADLLYVTFGTVISLGIPIEEIFLEVHKSNLTKSTSKQLGKTLKGLAFVPPQLDKILGFGNADK